MKSRHRKRPYPIDVKVDRTKLKKLAKKTKPRNKRERRLRRGLSLRAKLAKYRVEDAKLNDDLMEARKHRISEDEDDDPLPLDMIDPDHEDSFPAQEKSSSSDSDTTDGNEQFETDRQMIAEDGRCKHRSLLPIRTISGRVIRVQSRSEVLSDSEADESLATASGQSADENPSIRPMTAVEVYAERDRLLKECKLDIASICSDVVSDPAENIGKLKQLLQITSNKTYAPIMGTAVKLACASLTEVFADIAPGYCVREPTEAEMAQKAKKETKKLWEYEKMLLGTYRRYLQVLENFIKKMKRANASRFAKMLGNFSVRQMCSLLLRLSHFNYRNNILTVLVPLMSCKDASIRSLVCETFCQLFSEDMTGAVSLSAMKLVNQFMRNKHCKARPEMLEALLYLRLKDVKVKEESEEDASRSRKREDPFMKLSRRHRKYYKTLRRIQSDLKEIDAEEEQRVVHEYHTKITEHLFNVYFRILRHKPDRYMLRPLLEGLSKFAHLINVNFFDSLLSDMRTVLTMKDLSVLDSLHCVHSVLIVLSNEGQALNIDPYYFQNMLYRLFPKIMSESRKKLYLKEFGLYLRCLDMVINKRRKEISRTRVAAFVKRLCEYFPRMKAAELCASLLAIRSFLLSHPSLVCLIDDEEPSSACVYLPNTNDLEHCGAIGTKLHELKALHSHRLKLVRQLATHIMNNCENFGDGFVAPSLLSEAPHSVLQRLGQEQLKRCAPSAEPNQAT